MRKITAIFLTVVLLLGILPVSANETVADMSIEAGCNTVDGKMPLLGNQQLINNAKAALLYETTSDTLLYAHNADTQVPPSSLLKILTALIAIEQGSMTDVVTVRKEVLATLPYDAAVVELLVDEVVSVRDLLYCMMVSSGNDAAVVLADHIMGSQQAFVAEMNRRAAEYGCTGTNFVNVHGIHNENQYTTARDMAKILKKAIENEEFCKLFGAKYYTVPETNKWKERHLVSQNYLMNNDDMVIYFDERVTGSRTAIANDRSRSIASVAQVGDMQVICIVIGSKSQYTSDGYSERVYGGYNETKQLLDLGFTGYKSVQLIHENQVMLQNTVFGGSSDLFVGAVSAASSVIPDNINAENLVYRYTNEVPLTLPIEKGQAVSTLEVWCGNVCVAQTDLYAMNSVVSAAAQFADSDNKNGVSVWKILVFILLGIVALFVIALISLAVMRASRIAKAKRASRRNSRNRRRSR